MNLHLLVLFSLHCFMSFGLSIREEQIRDQQCPSTIPRSGGSCSLNPEKSCGYGEYCCCGKCEKSVFASCRNGRWEKSLADVMPCDPRACNKGPLDDRDYRHKMRLKKELIFEENGIEFKQHDFYNSDNNEAVIAVPAHGDFKETRFIMQGRSSESPVAGKMMVATESDCSLEDIPADINLEDMIIGDYGVQDTQQAEEVKIYQIRSDTKKATEEELENLSESMKEECAGKTVIVSSIKTYTETEFNANNFATKFSTVKANNVDNFKSVLRQKRETAKSCDSKYYGCALTSPTNCLRWSYSSLGPLVPQDGIQPRLHSLGGGENYCIECCSHEGSYHVPCSCINNEQKFSTAFAISRWFDGIFQYDCIKRSNYCKWDADATLDGCNYHTQEPIGTPRGTGACINDVSCPVDNYHNCATQADCNVIVGIQ